MDHIEYESKYKRLEAEYTSLKIDKDFQEREHPANSHPVINGDWLDYARDNGFNFNCLKLPRKDDKEWYDMVHIDFDAYEPFMDIHKEFVICPTCGTRWTLTIRLNGDYAVRNEYGDLVIDTGNKDNYYMFYFKLPKYISTVMDIMKVLDVIEMHKHGKGDVDYL